MSRALRIIEDEGIYHVLSRRAGKLTMFDGDGDYLAFEKATDEAARLAPMRIPAYCLMPNHWHLLLWPEEGQDLTRFVQWLTATHAARWNRAHGRIGGGAVYQARFKSIPVEYGAHLVWVWRYVERNALRANLVRRA